MKVIGPLRVLVPGLGNVANVFRDEIFEVLQEDSMVRLFVVQIVAVDDIFGRFSLSQRLVNDNFVPNLRTTIDQDTDEVAMAPGAAGEKIRLRLDNLDAAGITAIVQVSISPLG
ncbi:MAG: hypothetical protein V3T00_09780 [bacterium]